MQKAAKETLKKIAERRKDVINPPKKLETLFDWLAKRKIVLEKKKQYKDKEKNIQKEKIEDLPDGILLVGPSGTGKTHGMKALAGESGYGFCYISAGDIGGSFVHDGVEYIKATMKQVREKAKKNPVFFFIDEAHAFASKQISSNTSANSETQKALAQLLIELSNEEENKNIIFAAATNRPKELNKTFKRRFPYRIAFTFPDKESISRIRKLKS